MNDNQEPEIISAEEVIETIAPGLNIHEYNQIRENALKEAKETRHEWRGKGRGVIECQSCSTHHRCYIPMHVSLVGIDDTGSPIFKSID